MGISLSPEQIAALAPDTSAFNAAKKLAKTKHWQETGQSPEAIWGNCQGSDLYQVRIEVATLAIKCTCPSRKLPCKHGLALLLLAINEPGAVVETEQPEWITTWLVKRESAVKRKETIQAKLKEGPSDEQIKTAEKRMKLVSQGIEQLDLWLSDLVRNGLGSIGQNDDNLWQEQAVQMVNAQAPGLAGRVRRMAKLLNAPSAEWPVQLLSQMGELALLIRAFRRMEQVDPALQEEIRQMIGWTLNETEIKEIGERVKDSWLFVGQQTERVEYGYTQRIWLIGRNTKRRAYISQFRTKQQGFPNYYTMGTEIEGTAIYWPGAVPERILLEEAQESNSGKRPVTGRLPGDPDIATFLATTANTLARQPWRNRFLCVLRDVTLLYQQTSADWWLRDQQGQGLPLAKGENGYWKFLAVSGGQPMDMAAVWNGELLSPLGILAESNYTYTLH